MILMVMNQFCFLRKYSEDSKLVFFKEVYSWLSQNIIIVKPNTSFDNFQYYNDETSLELINKLIKTFDTGIDKVRVEKTDFEEFRKALPAKVYEGHTKQDGSQVIIFFGTNDHEN